MGGTAGIDHELLLLSQQKDNAMNKQTITLAVAGAIIGAVVVGSVPAALAAPASSAMSAFKQATLSDVTDVRYYRRGFYGRRAAIGLGVVGAAAAAAAIGRTL
jgi:hypothetical protein